MGTVRNASESFQGGAGPNFDNVCKVVGKRREMHETPAQLTKNRKGYVQG